MHSLTYKLKQMKRTVKSKLSGSQRGLLRLSYNIIRNPKKLRVHFNRLRYDNSVLCKSEINFIPPVFVATITDNCNLRCPTCLYLLEDPDKFIPSYISPDKFHQVLEKYNKEKKAETIFLTGGEPLLHPQIEEIVDICKEYQAAIKISSNGILVENKIPSLLKLDYVNVSIDGYDYQSYKKYRGGTTKQFDLVIEGIKALKENRINFSMSYLLLSENLSAVEQMLGLAEEIKPNFVSFHNINPHGYEQYSPLIIRDANTKLFLQRILKRCDYPFDIDLPYIFDPESPSFHNTKCVQPWYYFCFNSVGDISYCCHMAHDVRIGNVFMDYNLNSSAMVKFRDDIMRGITLPRCIFCQRRFMDGEFGSFDSKIRKWFIAY